MASATVLKMVAETLTHEPHQRSAFGGLLAQRKQSPIGTAIVFILHQKNKIKINTYTHTHILKYVCMYT